VFLCPPDTPVSFRIFNFFFQVFDPERKAIAKADARRAACQARLGF
jgi:hypothetical protein